MNRPLRIGYVVGGLEAAGSERQLLAVARGLIAAGGFAAEVVVLARPGDQAANALAAGIPVHGIPRGRSGSSVLQVARRRAARTIALARLFRRRRYDVVDAWLFHAAVPAALATVFAGTPVFVTGRRNTGAGEPIGHAADLLRRLADGRSGAIVANAPAVRAYVETRQPWAAHKVRVIPNGVVVPPIPDGAARVSARALLRIPAEARVVGSVANLKSGKGPDRLVAALPALLRRVPDLHLVLIGDGDLRRELEASVAAAGLAERVRFTGSIPDATALLPALDVFAHASDSEGLSNAVLEAAAAARPIVATAVGGTPDVVLDGVTGRLVAAGDSDALEGAIVALLADPGRALALGLAARDHVEGSYGMDRAVAAFADLYLELAEERVRR